MRLYKGVTLDDPIIRVGLLNQFENVGVVQKYHGIDRRIVADPTAVQILFADDLAVRTVHPKCSPMNSLLGGFGILAAVPEIKKLADDICTHLAGQPDGTPVMFSVLKQSVCLTKNEGRLDMLTLSSYNYLPFVLCGATYMHFMILQQYMCKRLGCNPCSHFIQISNTLACEETDFQILKDQPFQPLPLSKSPMCHNDPDIWWRDTQMLATEGPVSGFETRFVRKVLVPMVKAQKAISQTKDYAAALEHMEVCESISWKMASQEWIKAQADGQQEG